LHSYLFRVQYGFSSAGCVSVYCLMSMQCFDTRSVCLHMYVVSIFCSVVCWQI